jgi:carboxyl-terminal processing protease
MRAPLIIFLALLATASWAGTPHERSFDLVWRTVNETHYDPTFGGVDWEAAYDRYKPLVATAQTDAEFYARTNEMLFELNLSHLLAIPRDDLKRALPVVFAEGTVGVGVRLIGGEAVVTSVKPGSPGAQAGLRPGQVVRRVAGKSVTEIAREADARQIPPFNSRNRINRITNEILSHIYGPPETYVRLDVADESGDGRAITIRREGRGHGQVFSDALPPFYVEFEQSRLSNNIGYVRFNHFAAPVDKKLPAALESWEDARGLIIDLRGNPGGFFRVVDTIARRLVTKPTLFSSFRLRDRTVHNSVSPVAENVEGPVVVLVDVMSMSASEFFAGCMQAIGRATIVGERTPGFMLGADWVRLPNGGAFMHTILEPRTADGTVLEGRGVVPDIAIGLDRGLLSQGRDSQIEAAVRHILESSE